MLYHLKMDCIRQAYRFEWLLNFSMTVYFGRQKWPVEYGLFWFRGFNDYFEANLDDPKRNGRGTAKLPITQDANIIIFTIFQFKYELSRLLYKIRVHLSISCRFENRPFAKKIELLHQTTHISAWESGRKCYCCYCSLRIRVNNERIYPNLC